MRFGRFSSAAVAAVAALTLAVGGCASKSPKRRAAVPAAVAPSATASPSPSAVVLPAAVPPESLTVVDYYTAPVGFPADPAPMSTEPLTEGARPTARLAVYDAPGGVPKAFLTPVMNGLPLTVPIVARESGWVAVLLPTVNRTVGWLPPDGWTATPLRDQLVLHRATHQFTWYRDGAVLGAWTVTIGAARTQTPLGRTFVLGRSHLAGSVYAGLDVIVLGAVPDDKKAVASGLENAHTGIHSWYRDEWGRNVSNGCIRVPKAAQQAFLNEIAPGSEVLVLD